jgi:hypothetical protein
MWFRSDDIASLLVEDETTATITTADPELETVSLRPLTTAALLVACGIPSATPARLSDPDVFERLERPDGHVEVGPSQDGRIAGYTAPFLRRILTNLDAEEPVPESVRLRIPAPSPSMPDRRAADGQSVRTNDVRGRLPVRADVEVHVPDFLRRLSLYIAVPLLQDIIVGFNATLVIDSSIHHLLARNILCYDGSRIQQNGAYLTIDAFSLRGGISKIFHRVDKERLAIHSDILEELRAVSN